MIGIFNQASEDVRRQYSSFQLALVGLYSQAVDLNVPTAPSVRNRFTVDAHGAGISMLTAIAGVIDEAIRIAISDALAAAGDTSFENLDAMQQIQGEARNDVIDAVHAVATRDTAAVAKRLRDFGLTVGMKQSRMSYAGAVVQTRMEMGGAFTFSQLDRASRRWPSSEFVRNLARGLMVNVWIESYLYALAKRGIDLAQIVSENDHNGTVFSISGQTPGYPSFESLRSEVWHPNSNASAKEVA